MQVSLFTSPLAALAHEAIFLPWLKGVATSAAKAKKPVVVLVPQRADAYYLKSQALASGLGLWGIQFLTPGEIRDRLARHRSLEARIPLREHLRLLLATAAERLSAGNGADVSASVSVAPDQLLKTIDMIGAAGIDYAQVGPVRLRSVVAEFHRLLDQAGFRLMHEVDRDWPNALRRAEPCFAELFLLGFNALHWPLWPLLASAVGMAGKATVCLGEPRPEAYDLDAAWVGTWEETFGPAEPIGGDVPSSPLTEALRLPETDSARQERASQPVREIEFLVGTDTADHARAIVTRALQYLADPACERLGILFPAAGALARRVAALLAELAVPHNDGLAWQIPGPLETPDWPAWLALQESPRLPVLLEFLRARFVTDFAGLPFERVAADLRRTYEELLIDDLAVLATYLAGHPRESLRALSAALRALPLLPERASIREFFDRSAAIFRELAWIEREAALQRFADTWEKCPGLVISRRAWLRWLEETLVSWRAQRSESGSHPYSRLHLLPYAQAEAQSWTHLIATSLNEGQWPPALEEAGFLGEDEITALNQEAQKSNVRASVQGRQGEGHVVVQPGRTLCLGPVQRRALAERQFLNTVESTTNALTATMQLREESAPERPLNPSAYFTRLHLSARGRAVSQQTLLSLQEATSRWLRPAPFWNAPAPDPVAVQQTRTAFDARRDAMQPFGEYEFALRGTPSRPLRLAARQWEDAITSPAQTFLGVVLGVGANREEEETPWALAQGNWVHRWLKALTGSAERHTLSPLPAPAELRRRAFAAAEMVRNLASAALAAQRRALPDWWLSAWQQAWSATAQLVESIAAVQGRTHAATEWSLEDTALPVDAHHLFVRGRIDLLLSRNETIEDVWIVDYKTGNRQALRVKDIEAGSGLQLALYALALRSAGAREVGVSLLTPGVSLDQPQLHLADLGGLGNLWRALLQFQETGIFGMHGSLRSEFGFGHDYPLATLAVDEDILAGKWALTHPHLAAPEIET